MAPAVKGQAGSDLDRTYMSDLKRTDPSDLDWTNMSGPYKEELREKYKENKVRESNRARPNQDWPMAYWIHNNLKGRDPRDAGGRVIRSKPKYFLKHFEENFKKEGYPQPKNPPPSSGSGFKPLIEN